MTLPASGAISLSNVNVELALSSTAVISLNDTVVRSLFAVPSGAISMSNGYGKSSSSYTNVAIFIGTTRTSYTLDTAAVTGYSAGQTNVTLTINASTYLYSTNANVAALTVGTFAAGDTITIVNKGFVMGAGGNGATYTSTIPAGLKANNGGSAISLGFPVTIDNSLGYMGGGGGGGAGGFGSKTGGGGGAGGGTGGGSYYSGGLPVGTGGAGGATGSSGGAASGNAQNAASPISATIFYGSGGGGGRILNSPGGGAGGIVSPITGAQGGRQGGGGGYSIRGPSPTQQFNGGTGGALGATGGQGGDGTDSGAAGGGGGFGASGGPNGPSTSLPAGTGGKLIALNGFTATFTGPVGIRYGSIA